MAKKNTNARTETAQTTQPTPAPKAETVAERLAREAREAAQRQAAELAAKREADERKARERREREEAERKEREEAARLEAGRKAAQEREIKISRARNIKKQLAKIMERAELTYTHFESMVAVMSAFDKDRKAGKVNGLGALEDDFTKTLEWMQAVKQGLAVDLTQPNRLYARAYGAKGWAQAQAEMTEGEKLEREQAAS